MWQHGRTFILLAGLLCFIEIATGQTVTIQTITITGLKRTKESIVYRELTFAEGDTLLQSELGLTLERNKNNLINLGLFNVVVVNIAEWDTEKNIVDISIELKESWYIYAVPILELADRNFNVWWTTYNHSIDRINIGGKLDWLNFTGRNDKLKAKLQFGYIPKQEIEYRFPYLGKRQSFGITTSFVHSINKEVTYATVNNQEQQVRFDERKLQENYLAQLRTFYRPTHFMRYELALSYHASEINEQVITDYNPTYFRNGDSTQNVFGLRFVAEYDDRDVKLFPSKGIKAAIDMEKKGFGQQADENSLVSTLTFEWNTTTGRRFQHRAATIGKYSLSRSKPSYIYYRGLGSGQKYVSGYELYVVDGLDFALFKYQLSYRLVEKEINFEKLMPVDQFRHMNYAIYLSLLTEAGIVNDPYTGNENPFSNRWLYGGGPGLSLLLYNNFLFQFSYSVNHVGEWGFFIHNRTSF